MNKHKFIDQSDPSYQNREYNCLKCNKCVCPWCHIALIMIRSLWMNSIDEIDVLYNRKLIGANDSCSLSDDEYMIKNIIE